MERILLLGKIGRHVWRAEQAPCEVVIPRMIRTLNPIDEVSLRLRANSGATVAAHVEERVNRPRLVAGDDDAFRGKRAGEVIAGIRNLVGAAGTNPPVEIETVEFLLIELGIGVKAARQRCVHRT